MIQLKNVTLRRSAKVLLDAASVTLNPGEKVGLVGRNGAGKSTLFALFNGTLHEDGGDFSIPKQWRLAQVAQDMPETEESVQRILFWVAIQNWPSCVLCFMQQSFQKMAWPWRMLTLTWPMLVNTTRYPELNL